MHILFKSSGHSSSGVAAQRALTYRSYHKGTPKQTHPVAPSLYLPVHSRNFNSSPGRLKTLGIPIRLLRSQSLFSTHKRCRRYRGPAHAGNRTALDRAAPHRHREPPCSCGSRHRSSRSPTESVPHLRQTRYRLWNFLHSSPASAPTPAQREPSPVGREPQSLAPVTVNRQLLALATGCRQPWEQGLVSTPQWAPTPPSAGTEHRPMRQQRQAQPQVQMSQHWGQFSSNSSDASASDCNIGWDQHRNMLTNMEEKGVHS